MLRKTSAGLRLASQGVLRKTSGKILFRFFSFSFFGIKMGF